MSRASRVGCFSTVAQRCVSGRGSGCVHQAPFVPEREDRDRLSRKSRGGREAGGGCSGAVGTVGPLGRCRPWLAPECSRWQPPPRCTGGWSGGLVAPLGMAGRLGQSTARFCPPFPPGQPRWPSGPVPWHPPRLVRPIPAGLVSSRQGHLVAITVGG